MKGENLENQDQSAGVETTKGALYQSLERSNAQIRKERGDVIAEDLETVFKRNVEDLELKVKRLTRDRANMYDFSPTNTQSLVMAKDLDSTEILEKDMTLSVELRNVVIKLEVAKERYLFLFGKTI